MTLRQLRPIEVSLALVMQSRELPPGPFPPILAIAAERNVPEVGDDFRIVLCVFTVVPQSAAGECLHGLDVPGMHLECCSVLADRVVDTPHSL